MKANRIFISHISKETELAQCLKGILLQDFPELDIFVSSDRESIKLGDQWLGEVDKALEKADILIILCSKESVSRPWVNFEAGAAWIRKIPVIPVCHSGLSTGELPSPLSMLQGISGNEEEGLKKLYDRISEYLKVDFPSTDFPAISAKVKEIEAQYISRIHEVEVIVNPKILCAASAYFMQPSMEFNLDVAVLEKAFPGCVQVEHNLTRKSLRELLTNQKFDIIHLVIGVDKENGDLVFSDMDPTTQKPVSFSKQVMTADSFAHLLLESETQLVVLGTCNALLLAVEVSRFANMAASDATLTGMQAEEWGDCFYGLLANEKTLFKAFDITRNQLRDIPIRAIRHKDIAFSVDEKEGRTGLQR